MQTWSLFFTGRQAQMLHSPLLEPQALRRIGPLLLNSHNVRQTVLSVNGRKLSKPYFWPAHQVGDWHGRTSQNKLQNETLVLSTANRLWQCGRVLHLPPSELPFRLYNSQRSQSRLLRSCHRFYIKAVHDKCNRIPPRCVRHPRIFFTISAATLRTWLSLRCPTLDI